jgi:hypothetical protein
VLRCGVAVLQGAHRLLLKTTNIKMGVRLGLLKQDHSRALVFEVDSAKMKGEKERYIAGQGNCSQLQTGFCSCSVSSGFCPRL